MVDLAALNFRSVTLGIALALTLFFVAIGLLPVSLTRA